MIFWVTGLDGPRGVLLGPIGANRGGPGSFRHECSGRRAACPLCAALGLEGHETEEEVAGRAVAVEPGRWTAVPLPSGPRRALLVAERPTDRPWGPRALHGAAGARLAKIAGLDLPTLLWTFETANIPDGAAAEALVSRVRGRHVVVLGRAAAERLRAASGAACVEFIGVDCRMRSVWLAPHPSGRSSTALDGAHARRELAGALAAAAFASRTTSPPPPCAPPRRWCETAAPDMWRRMAHEGVAAGGERGVPWTPLRQVAPALGPAWASHWPRATLLVSVRPCAWMVATADGSTLSGPAPGVAEAKYLAERSARVLGMVDPWHALDARLARGAA